MLTKKETEIFERAVGLLEEVHTSLESRGVKFDPNNDSGDMYYLTCSFLELENVETYQEPEITIPDGLIEVIQ